MEKICIITPMFLPVPAVNGGAIEKLVTILLDENEKYQNYEIDLYTIANSKLKDNYNNTKIIQVKLNNILFFIQRVVNKLCNIFHTGLYFDFHVFLYSKISRMVSKKKYSKILVENNMLLYKKVYKKINNISFYFHLHNDLNENNKKLEDYKFILKTCDKIIVVSNYLKEKLKKLIVSDKIEVLHNVIDDNFFINYKYSIENINEVKENLNINSNNKVIGYVGRIDKEKGLLELIKAFNKLNLKNYKLLIVGEDFTELKYKSKYKQELLNQFLKNKNNIIVTGFISYDKLPLYYKIIDLLVIPTICQEAFGMVALEGKILNKKIVYTESGALPEILKGYNSIKVSLKGNVINNLCDGIKTAIKENLFNKKEDIFKKMDEDNLNKYYKKFIDIINM